MKRLLFITPVVALILSGCPAPAPEPGPMPTPGSQTETSTTGQVSTDGSDEQAAPVLPPPDLGGAVDEPSTTPTTAPETTVMTPVVTPSATGTSSATGQVWSAQVFASSTSQGAESVAERVRGMVQAPVDVVEEGGRFIVYAGRCAQRGPADAIRDALRGNGFSGAWTKQRVIAGAATAVEPAPVPTTTASGPCYSVQVFSSSAGRENADRVAAEVRGRTTMPVEVVQVDGTWKVYVGRSATREPIDAERDRLRSGGYPDAWTAHRSQ